ncbi:hypothetical protein EJ08DRAFT_671442 [Tothia fuscella]|uniref:Uncharacterized protein n=1 Tax=Tothia fuscella TaxID=1048955 RepID=A0A9P4NNI3_9PEZI|nr:hypothetical protein EJ08DRAFT_671442 [Tothia fuscella]
MLRTQNVLAVLFAALPIVQCAPAGAAPPPPSPLRADQAASLKEATWNPPANPRSALDAVWKYDMPDPLKFKNYGFLHVLDNKGKINFCVRWDSKKTAIPEIRRQIDAALKRRPQWMDVYAGFDGWPYKEVAVKVTGWSVRSLSLLPGYNASEGFTLYNDKDRGGVPQCSEKCGRFFHQNNDYSKCPGGVASHYDMSLWLTDGMNGGATRNRRFLSALNSNTQDFHIFLHEMGHTFALDDYYTWKPPGAMYITEFDAWMIRDW